MDHLEGKLFVDYLSPLKRQMVRKKLDKQRRQKLADQQISPARPAP
jgi:peptide deformylase